MSNNYYKRLEADYLKKIEIWYLKSNGWLQPGIDHHFLSWNKNGERSDVGIRIIINHNTKFVELLYTLVDLDGKKTNIDTQVMLVTTKCNFGGKRYWFKCPDCLRRIGVLYYRNGYFSCRHCQYLTYVSKKVNGVEKITGRIVSDKEVEALRLKAKRTVYNGKATKNHTRYMTKLLRQRRTMKALYG